MSLKTQKSSRMQLPRGNTNLVLVPRKTSRNLTAWLRRHLPKRKPLDGAQSLYTFNNEGTSNDVRLRKVLSDIGLPTTGKNADAFCTDVQKLAAAYRNLLGLPCIGMRFDVGSANVGWHTDRDGREPRLLITYIGRGTEWVSEDDVRERNLQTNSVWVENDVKARAVPTGWLALLRGGREKGAIHRSPKLPTNGQKRLLIIFEPTSGDHIAETRYVFKPSLRHRLGNA